jgi:hypothetical protein
MSENAISKSTSEAAGSPALPQPLRTIAVDVLLPWLAVQLLLRFAHLSIVPALAIAAVFPAVSMVRSWIRQRHVDFIGLAVFVTILGGIAVALLVDDPRFAVLKGAPGFALFGIACLISLTRKRPLMFYVARQFNAAGDKAKVAAWTARLENPRFRQAMRLLTLVWGVALLVEAPLGIAAAFLLPPTTAMVVEPMLGVGTISALLAWTFAFARRRQAAAAADAAASPVLGA